jgi:hypothetical protein
MSYLQAARCRGRIARAQYSKLSEGPYVPVIHVVPPVPTLDVPAAVVASHSHCSATTTGSGWNVPRTNDRYRKSAPALRQRARQAQVNVSDLVMGEKSS